MVVVSRRKKLETGVSLQLNNLEDTRSKTGRVFFFFFFPGKHFCFSDRIFVSWDKNHFLKACRNWILILTRNISHPREERASPPQKKSSLKHMQMGHGFKAPVLEAKNRFCLKKLLMMKKHRSENFGWSTEVRTLDGPRLIWVFPKMMVSQKHPKMIIFSRKTHGCWVPPFKETPIWKSLPPVEFHWSEKKMTTHELHELTDHDR